LAPAHTAVVPNEPLLTVNRGEYDAAPYMVDARYLQPSGKIIATVDRASAQLSHDDAGLHLYDRIYITPPPGLSPPVGSHLVLAVFGDVVPDIGVVVQPTGIVSIDSVAGNGILVATIVQQFGVIQVEQRTIVPGHTFTETHARPVEGQYTEASSLVWVKNQPLLPSLQTYVMLAPTSGLHLGDVMTVYDTPHTEDGVALPPVATATAKVVRITSYAITALVIHQNQPKIRVGMPARITAKIALVK
jgi:hypothetical protein